MTTARKCASFSKKAGTLTSLSPQADIAPRNQPRNHTKNVTEQKKPTEFHSLSPTIHKTLKSKMSFSKTSKFSAMIPKLNKYFLYHHLFHSNATKTKVTFQLRAHLSVTTNQEPSNVNAHDAKLVPLFLTRLRSQDPIDPLKSLTTLRASP